jgi:hypothetical protein
MYTDDTNCLSANTNWDFTEKPRITVTDPNNCLKISFNCCYVNMNYSIGDIQYENAYCYTMTGNISAFVKTIVNFYSDENIYWNNYTFNNYGMYSMIGSNLVYDYYQNYSCYTPQYIQNYSTYNASVCAVFDNNGNCIVENDYDYFNSYVNALYESLTSTYCNSVDASGNCINYTSYENNTALQPLLDILIQSLGVDSNVTNSSLNNDTNNNSSNSNNSNNNNGWPNPCLPPSPITVKVICPPDYVKSNSISFSFLCNLFIIIVYLLL